MARRQVGATRRQTRPPAPVRAPLRAPAPAAAASATCRAAAPRHPALAHHAPHSNQHLASSRWPKSKPRSRAPWERTQAARDRGKRTVKRAAYCSAVSCLPALTALRMATYAVLVFQGRPPATMASSTWSTCARLDSIQGGRRQREQQTKQRRRRAPCTHALHWLGVVGATCLAPPSGPPSAALTLCSSCRLPQCMSAVCTPLYDSTRPASLARRMPDASTSGASHRTHACKHARAHTPGGHRHHDIEPRSVRTLPSSAMRWDASRRTHLHKGQGQAWAPQRPPGLAHRRLGPPHRHARRQRRPHVLGAAGRAQHHEERLHQPPQRCGTARRSGGGAPRQTVCVCVGGGRVGPLRAANWCAAAGLLSPKRPPCGVRWSARRVMSCSSCLQVRPGSANQPAQRRRRTPVHERGSCR